MGERRTAMQSDDSGTEVRIEDRWAAVRREETRRSESRREPDREWERGRDADRGREVHGDSDGDWARDRGGRAEASWSDPRFEDARADDPGRRRGGPAALPSTPSEPGASTWLEGWNARPEPVSERIRRSRRADDEGYRWNGRADEDPPAGRSHREYDGDDRWR
jgi:hypothetical protein